MKASCIRRHTEFPGDFGACESGYQISQYLELTIAEGLKEPNSGKFLRHQVSCGFGDNFSQKLIDFMAFDSKHREPLGVIVRSLCQDEHTINYRLDIIDELVRFPRLVSCIDGLLPVLRDLKYYETFLALEWKTSLQEAIWRLRELEHYVDCVQKMAEAFQGIAKQLRSRALKQLSALVLKIQKDPVYQRLVVALPDLLSRIRGIKSITIGVNLDAGLMPCEATLISINADRYKESPFLKNLFGEDQWQGIGPLHRAPAGSESATCL